MEIGTGVAKLTPAKAGKVPTDPGVPIEAGHHVACQVLADVFDVMFPAMRLVFTET